MFKNWNWDAIGIGTSLACAIHCALLPLFFSTLPLLGINVLHNPSFEFGMILLSFGIGAYSLYHGYKKHHHSFKPIILFSIGIGLMFCRMVFREAELYLLFPAAFLSSSRISTTTIVVECITMRTKMIVIIRAIIRSYN
jgi:hypothetical protein